MPKKERDQQWRLVELVAEREIHPHGSVGIDGQALGNTSLRQASEEGSVDQVSDIWASELHLHQLPSALEARIQNSPDDRKLAHCLLL